MTSIKALLKTAIAALLVFNVQNVSAQESSAPDSNTRADAQEPPFTRRIYAGIGLGLTRLEPRSRVAGITVGDKNDSGIHFNLGMDVKRWLSAEVLLADLGAAGIDQLSRQIDEIDYQIFDLNAIFYLLNSQSDRNSDRQADGLYRREGLSLIARTGIGAMRNSSSFVDHGKNFRAHLAVGLGLEYGFRSGFALRGEYIAFDSDAHYATIAAIKRFGKVNRYLPVPEDLPRSRPVPEEGPKEAPLAPPIFPPDTLFETDSYTLSSKAKEKFEMFALQVLKTDKSLTIEGHTDWVGSDDYNLGLGQRRANAVRKFLVSKGITESRIQTESFGESRPVSTNDTAEGRSQNRRVVVLLD